MTTKEEKARLAAIRTIMIEVVAEIDEILGESQEREFIAAKVEKGETEVTPEAVKQIKEVLKATEAEPKDKVQKIGDLNIGDEGIVIEAEILEIETNSGTTKAGKPYKVTKLTLSDKSGPIKLVLWNEQTEQADGLEINDVIRVEAWKVEKGYKGGVHEIVYGQFGTIEQIKHGIERHII